MSVRLGQFRSLRARLVAATTATAVITFAGFVALVLLRADRGLTEQAVQVTQLSKDRLAERLDGDARLARSLILTMLDDVAHRFAAIAQRSDLEQAVRSGNVVAISEILGPALTLSDIDGAVVLDAQLRAIGAHSLDHDILRVGAALRHTALAPQVQSIIADNDRQRRRAYRTQLELDPLTAAALGVPSTISLSEVMIEPVFDDFGDVVAVLVGHRTVREQEAALADFFALSSRAISIVRQGQLISGAGPSAVVPRVPREFDGPLLISEDGQHVARCVELRAGAQACALASASELQHLRAQLIEIGEGQTRSLLGWLIATAVVSVLIFAFVSILISRHVTRPLIQITRAVTAVARGDLDVNVAGAERHDEVGDIARAVVVLKGSVQERERAEARIAHMARHDAVTGLGNRLLLRESMEAVARLDKEGWARVVVLCIDLDDFKSVNDTLGHSAGDMLLRMAASRLLDTVPDGATVTRLGGDEFAIVYLMAAPDEAGALARRLIDVLSEPFAIDGNQIVLGASVGIATGAQCQVPDDLLKSADLALYLAKADGRAHYRLFEPEMHAQLQARRGLEQDLQQALAKGEFQIYYQPVFNLLRNRISGFEALLRWHHPTRGVVPPSDFIPIAEELGLIDSIGEWVLRTACLEATKWPPHLKVAVNISPMQFRSRTLAQAVVHALAASGLQSSRLDLEITESAVLHDNEWTFATLHQLRLLGVRISMDDFGTGYSSLSCLRRFPFDHIKLDQSFLRDAAGRADCAAIVGAVASLGKALGITTIAEGVETAEQLERLRAEGYAEAQGYLFGSAVPADRVAWLLRKERVVPSVA